MKASERGKSGNGRETQIPIRLRSSPQSTTALAMVFSTLFDDATSLAAELRLHLPGDPVTKNGGPNFHSLIHKFRQIFAYSATPTMHLPTSHYILLASISLVAISHAAPVAGPQETSTQPVCVNGATYLDFTPYTCNLQCEDVKSEDLKGRCTHEAAQAPAVGYVGWLCNCSHDEGS